MTRPKLFFCTICERKSAKFYGIYYSKLSCEDNTIGSFKHDYLLIYIHGNKGCVTLWMTGEFEGADCTNGESASPSVTLAFQNILLGFNPGVKENSIDSPSRH